jgi:hypothetical protein
MLNLPLLCSNGVRKHYRNVLEVEDAISLYPRIDSVAP